MSNERQSLQAGRATRAGTRRYAERFAHLPDHFRSPDGLAVSSIALGTRRGRPGGADDLLYRAAVSRSLELGCNLIDTAHSDRVQTSERAVGAALARAFVEGIAQRDEVVVVTKGGSLVPDPDFARGPLDARQYLQRTYVDSGILDPANVIGGHALDARFLRDQIDRSRRNLRLDTLDLFLVEEPERHLRALGPTEFRARITQVFRALEQAVADGAIAAYGIASWDGFLVPASEREHLAAVDVFEAALEAGGGDHHLRAIQLPYGMASGEAAVVESQLGSDGQSSAILDSLRGTGTLVLASAPLFGGRVLGHVPDFVRHAFPEAKGDAQICLQFARSTAGIHSAVVGMRDPDHVEENLALCRVAPARSEVVTELFRGVQ